MMPNTLTLSRSEAAAEVGIPCRTFDDWVSRKIVPGPIPGTRRWSRDALRQAVNRQLDTAETNEADLALLEWEAQHGGAA